jgi:putative endonuclease
MDKHPCVYILASRKHGTLYIGVTSNILQRLEAHRSGAVPGFTSKYGVYRPVYVEFLETMDSAITREKQIKKWNRAWKIRLIERLNPAWRDLAEEM